MSEKGAASPTLTSDELCVVVDRDGRRLWPRRVDMVPSPVEVAEVIEVRPFADPPAPSRNRHERRRVAALSRKRGVR